MTLFLIHQILKVYKFFLNFLSLSFSLYVFFLSLSLSLSLLLIRIQSAGSFGGAWADPPILRGFYAPCLSYSVKIYIKKVQTSFSVNKHIHVINET